MTPLAAVITARRVGIELEVAVPIVGKGNTRDIQELLAQILTNHSIPAHVRPYSRSPIPAGYQLSIEHDSTIQGQKRFAGVSWSQIEVKTQAMTYGELQGFLPQALEIIRYLGARVTPSCGLHVHHDLTEIREHPRIARNLINLWWRYHQVIYGLVAPSRRSNTYCRPPQREEVTRFAECNNYGRLNHLVSQANRHQGLNLTNLSEPGRLTVEWRIHGGTTDWEKIRAWVLATQRWVEHAARRSCQFRSDPLPNTQASLNSMLITTGLKPNSRIYPHVDKELRLVGRFLLKRWKHFQKEE